MSARGEKAAGTAVWVAAEQRGIPNIWTISGFDSETLLLPYCWKTNASIRGNTCIGDQPYVNTSDTLELLTDIRLIVSRGRRISTPSRDQICGEACFCEDKAERMPWKWMNASNIGHNHDLWNLFLSLICPRAICELNL